MKLFFTALLFIFSTVVFAQNQNQVNEHTYTIKVKENNSNVQALIKDLKAKKGIENCKFDASKKQITFVVGAENMKGNEEKAIMSIVKKNKVQYDGFDIKASYNSSRSNVSKKKR